MTKLKYHKPYLRYHILYWLNFNRWRVTLFWGSNIKRIPIAQNNLNVFELENRYQKLQLKNWSIQPSYLSTVFANPLVNFFQLFPLAVFEKCDTWRHFLREKAFLPRQSLVERNHYNFHRCVFAPSERRKPLSCNVENGLEVSRTWSDYCHTEAQWIPRAVSIAT